jgi:protein-arginine kinase activator protein McsA
MNKFNTLLLDLNQKVSSPKDQIYQITLKVRKQCLDLFQEIETIAKKVKQLPTSNIQEQKLNEFIYISTMQFLQSNMFTLRLMPAIKNPDTTKPPKIIPEKVNVVQDTIKELSQQMQELIKKRKFEDASIIKEQIKELESEFTLITLDN